MVGGDKRQRFVLKMLRALLFAALLVFIPQTAFAQNNRIRSLDIRVLLDEKGTGHFTETWEVDFHDKTEIYRPMGDLGGADLTNYKVSQDGVPLEERTPWDPDASFEAKAGKYGINPLDWGFELCFGLGKYGPTSFTVTYDVEGLVMQYDDYQAIYWKFVNDDMSPAPEKVNITIEGPAPFSYETERIWGFGFEGWIDIPQDGGPITMESLSALNSSNHVVLLARFPQGKFLTENHHHEPFDNLIALAFPGSSYKEEEYDPHATYEDLLRMDAEEAEKEDLFDKIISIIFALVWIVVGLVFIYEFLVHLKKKKLEKEIFPDIKTLSKDLQGEYVRDLPYKSVFETYDLLEKMKLADLEANFLTAGILQLIVRGNLIPQSVEKGLIFKKDETSLQIVHTLGMPEGPLTVLFDLIVKSAGVDGILTQKEFSTYVSKNTSAYDRYTKTLTRFSKDHLKAYNYYGPAPQAKKGMEARAMEKLQEDYNLFPSPQGAQARDDLVRFQNYLKDFSLLNERESREVALWDRLMVYAAAFGITDQVEKEFEKLYPQYQAETTYSPGTVIWAQNFGHTVNRSYVSAVAAKESYSSARSSSGGGGFSSGGGGGGSFGGGSGGGGR